MGWPTGAALLKERGYDVDTSLSGKTLGVLGVVLSIAVLAMNRATVADEKASKAQRTADVNEVRIEGVAKDISRIEVHMDKLGDQFERIDGKFEAVQKDIQTIMLCLPRRAHNP